MKLSERAVKIFLLLLWLHTGRASAAAIAVGAAGIDITPDYPIRLSGYGARRTVSEGVEHRIHAKALAMGDEKGGNLTLILTVDNVGIPAWITEKVFEEIAKSKPLAREQFTICASHTHSAPMLAGTLENLFGMDIPADQWEVVKKYSDELAGKLAQVGLQAIGAMRRADLFWAVGQVGFAKNRRTEGGPVDHEAPILAARAEGKWIAILANYACHCTTLGGEFNKVCGDWAGYAQEAIETKFPGAIALVAIGCGGDANPNPRGLLAQAQQYGGELATEAERVLKGELKPLNSLPKGALSRFKLAFDTLPTRAQWEELARQNNAIGYHARKNLARLDRGEALPTELEYSTQALAFGDDLAMVFLPGEVVVDYALRIKRSYAAHRVWVNAYSNDDPCYIPSKRILAEGGYEGGGAMVYYDRPTKLAPDTEERIIAQVDRLMPAAYKMDAAKEAQPAPKSPAEALQSFRLRPGFEIDLVASEPLVIDPVAIDFAADGRLWVAEMHDYPMGIDGHFKPGGRIKALSSSRGDGKFDHADTLVDDVPFPTGVMAWGKGALVCAAPDILYIEDTDGDGKADVRRILYSGFATHNYQARVNCLRWGLDGWIYGAAGLFGGTIRSELTGSEFALSGRDFRIKPDSGAFEAVGGLSQQGRVRDDFGNWFGCDNGMWAWHFPLPDHYLARNPKIAYPDSRVAVARGRNANEVYPASVTLERFNDPGSANHTTSACGIEVYHDVALGAEFYHNIFTPEPVHNLVHRLVVTPEGTTFSGRRAAGEERTEFLASTDNWFRPAETRTGPDGALWVVDMYRYVIEHPRWISSNRLAQLDVRAGDRQGRIYRVRRAGDQRPPTWPDLTKFSDLKLTEVIGGNNGVLRDLAHRLLLERKSSATNALQQIVQSDRPAGGRVQALYLLEQLGGNWNAASGDKDAAVRRAAVELSEKHPDQIAISGLADSDPFVRLQMAFSLGEKNSPEAAQALGELAAHNLSDARMRFAVLSSATKAPATILAAVLKTPANAPGRREMVDGLIRTAAGTPDAAAALDLVMPKENEAFAPWRLEAANALLQANPGALPTSLNRARSQARAVAGDATTDARSRQIALEILAHPPLQDKDLELFANLLDSGAASELQTAALNGLRHSSDARVADLMLTNWTGKGLQLRAAMIDELLQREPWTERLLTALEGGVVNPREIGAVPRQMLTRHANASLAERAAKLFAQDVSSDRGALVASYASVETLNGNPDRGLALFAANCAPCHLYRGLGNAVGPDLMTYHDKPVADFLLAILHPNAAIEPRFLNYQIETKDDRSLSGVLSGETATSVTVVGANGARETLLRSQIASMKSSTFSLMPEGFEAALDFHGMADLIRYLKSKAPLAFGSGGESREHFQQEASNPATRILFASEVIDYPSPFGRAPLYFCRQSDGKQRVEWECAPPKLDKTSAQFIFPIAIGFISQPKGEFALFLNGKKECAFNVSLNDMAFSNAAGTVRGSYRVMDRNREDSNGVLLLEVAKELLPEGQPVRWSVTGSAADGQRWFGIYALDASMTPPKTEAKAN